MTKNYNLFLEDTYKNTYWITIIDSNKAWKNLAIFAITHWNEPVWLQIFDYLVNDFNISKKLKKWKIFLIANNIKAYKKYRKTKDISSYRFLDDNLNRISNKDFKKWSYEFKRLDELKEIFKEIDLAIDLHSVSKWNDIIWLCDKKHLKTAKSFFNVETILIDNMWKTWALIWEFLRNNKEAYWIECWNHISNDGFEKAKENILNFLQKFSSIENVKITNNFNEVYEFAKEIKVKTNNFKFTKDFKWWFNKIKIWEVYSIDWEEELKNNFWKDIFLGIPAKNPIKWDWAGFLFYKN